jgi:hypothetical protein
MAIYNQVALPPDLLAGCNASADIVDALIELMIEC